MIILSFNCIEKVNKTITAQLTSAEIYPNTVIQISEYQDNNQLTPWITLDNLQTLTQNITYTITNNNTNILTTRLALINCVIGSEGSISGSGSESGSGSGSGSGSESGSESGSGSGSEVSGSEGSIGSGDIEASGSIGSSSGGSESGCSDCISESYTINVCTLELSGGQESGSGSGPYDPCDDPDQLANRANLGSGSGSGSGSGDTTNPNSIWNFGNNIPINVNIPNQLNVPLPAQPQQPVVIGGGIIGGILENADDGGFGGNSGRSDRFTIITDLHLVGMSQQQVQPVVRTDFYTTAECPPSNTSLLVNSPSNPVGSTYDFTLSESSSEWANYKKGIRNQQKIQLVVGETNNLSLTLDRSAIQLPGIASEAADCIFATKTINQSITVFNSEPQPATLYYCLNGDPTYQSIVVNYDQPINIPQEAACFTPYGYLTITFPTYTYTPEIDNIVFTTQCGNNAEFIQIQKSIIDNGDNWLVKYFVYANEHISSAVGQMKVSYSMDIKYTTSNITTITGDIYIGTGQSETRNENASNPYSSYENTYYQNLESISESSLSDTTTVYLDPFGRSIARYDLNGTPISAIVGDNHARSIVYPSTTFSYGNNTTYQGCSVNIGLEGYGNDTQFSSFPVAPVSDDESMLVTNGWYRINCIDCNNNQLVSFNQPVDTKVNFDPSSPLEELERFKAYKLVNDGTIWEWVEQGIPVIDLVDNVFIVSQTTASTWNLDAKVNDYCKMLICHVPKEVRDAVGGVTQVDAFDAYNNRIWILNQSVELELTITPHFNGTINSSYTNIRSINSTPIRILRAPKRSTNDTVLNYSFKFIYQNNQVGPSVQFSDDSRGVTEVCGSDDPCNSGSN